MVSSQSVGMVPFFLKVLIELQEASLFNLNALPDVHPLWFKNADVLILTYSVDPILDPNHSF